MVKLMKVLLHEMSWIEAKEYFSKNDIAIIPVGSNEQPNALEFSVYRLFLSA